MTDDARQTRLWQLSFEILAETSRGAKVKSLRLSLRMVLFTLLVTVVAVPAYGQVDGIVAVAWSPDGTKIAVSGTNGLLQIRDTNNQLIRDIAGLTTIIGSVDWSPDSTKIVSGGDDGTVIVWNASTGQQLASLIGFEAYIQQVDWSPDGSKILATGIRYTPFATLIVWNATTYQQLAARNAGEAFGANWSPDSSEIAVAKGIGYVSRYSPNLGPSVASYSINAGVLSVAWSPDGSKIAGGTSIVGTSTNEIKIWNTTTGSVTTSLAGHTKLVSAVAFSPNGQQLASASSDGTVRVWDVATGQQVASFPKPATLTTSIAWSPDGSQLAFGGTSGGLQIAPAPGAPTATNSTPTPAITPLWENTQNLPQGVYIDWHPDGSMLAVATNSTVKIVSATTGQLLNTLPNFVDKVYTVDWSPDGTNLAIAVGTEVQIWNNVWNGSTASVIVNFQGHHIDRVGSIAWDNTGNRIISASADKALIWNSQTARIQQTLIQIPGPMVEAIWSPNGDIVATSGFDSQVIFWNPSNGQIVGGFGVLYGSGATLVTAISWKPDGSQIATSSEEGIIRIWDVTQSSPLELVALYGHTKDVLSLAWKPNSDLLASSSMDGTIRIWNTANTEQLQITEIDLLISVTWKPDGSTLVYIDADGILQNIFTPVSTPTATP